MSNTTRYQEGPIAPETTWQKTTRKAKEEPLVPVGLVLTTAALIMATRSMRQGNRAQFNRMLRFRVAAQAFTVVAALGGSIWYGEARRKEKADEKLARSKSLRDKEFDKSMKLAEAATAAETTG
ncbi:hypothetical protein P389DRAFT_39220 [Cystobasidium minutum MCA 4210]|uniref:uncharacterized protein n=1 Tax=Cystobasidium minutum MCA 4210 TaxID=1397322 RepID=UPI0034CF2EC7|eukprot:jgi/Rhomi1/39220/CE39219_1356